MNSNNDAEQAESPSRILPLLTVSMFVSAALLFLLQPMFGKMILPVFGGAPAVWITSLVFFQLMLLAGYLYVHASVAWLGPKKQATLHAALLLIPLVVLPIRIFSGWGLTSPLRPISSVFLVLLASVGLPFIVVSTTAPLLQRWFGSTKHHLASDPFFLYAASNVGSIGALLAYPLLVEPRLHLDTQGRVWSVGYGLLVVLTLGCVVAVRRSLPVDSAPSETATEASRVSRRTRLRWIALAAVPSSLLLSVTTHITTNIAPIPLLWVIPLTIYLGTFVLAFSPGTTFLTRYAWYALPFIVFVPLATMLSGIVEPPGFMLFHLAVFAVAAMLCHGELAASRPGVDRLTEFYVWLAIGGAIGGLFNVVIAPIVFRTLAEYPLGLILACLLRPAPEESPDISRDWMMDIAHALAIGVLTFIAARIVGSNFTPKGSLTFAAYVLAVPAAIALSFYVWRPVRFALALAAMSFIVARYPDPSQSLIATERSFYGVYRIIDRADYRVLFHGATNHGAQSLELARRCVPLSYYYPTGPLGELFSAFTGQLTKSNIGIIGLGTGSIGGYAQPTQHWTFYEIDPAVEDIARNPLYFNFLSECVPQARVVLGDARISLARQPDAIHDVLVIDAFSSDAIPVHLLTREAMALYMRKLAPRGVLAFHISNKYFNLQGPLARLARDAGLLAGIREDNEGTPLEKIQGKTPSVWVMMARSPADLGLLTGDRRWLRFPPDVAGDSWTDNYSNVLETLQLR